MKDIKTVGIIGLGALGVLYSHLFTQGLGQDRVLVLADGDRIARYKRDGVYLNGQLCAFNYTDAAAIAEPVDLLLFAVKFSGLEGAISTCRHLVGPDTTIISVLNGITSEEVLAQAFGREKLVWCVAQKMSAVKEGNHAVISPFGELALGVPAGMDRSRLEALLRLMDSIRFPYVLPEDILRHMWSKLLVNTGCNQAAMVFQCGYGGLKTGQPAHDTMVGAMEEVMAVANAEGIHLTQADIQGWVELIDGFPDQGEPSMRQDGKAHRKSEVDLFAGTIRRLGAKHGIPTPVNDWLYEKVMEMERQY